MVIKEKRIIWAGPVACSEDEKCVHSVSWKTWREEITWKT